MKAKVNKKSLAYKISKYDLQDEAVVLFLGFFGIILSILFLPDALADTDEYSIYFWLSGSLTVVSFVIVALKLASRKIKNHNKVKKNIDYDRK